MNRGRVKIMFLIIVLTCFFSTVSAQDKIGSKDSIFLVNFVRKVYQWHLSQIPFDKGFDPKKDHPSDTFYKGIDFNAVDFMIRKLRVSGYFDESFLENYRSIALRMDRQLRNGSATWREGAMPPFNGTDDPWCNCDYTTVKHWLKIKPIMPVLIDNTINFKLNLSGNVLYQVKVKKAKTGWKITYLEGFDPGHYKWFE